MSAFGGIAINNNSTTDTVGTTTHTVRRFTLDMQSRGVTLASVDGTAGSITVGVGGKYEIRYSIGMKSAADLENYQFKLRNNGTDINESAQSVDLSDANAVEVCSGAMIEDLADGDVITLGCVAGSAGNTVTFVDGQLWVNRIGVES